MRWPNLPRCTWRNAVKKNYCRKEDKSAKKWKKEPACVLSFSFLVARTLVLSAKPVTTRTGPLFQFSFPWLVFPLFSSFLQQIIDVPQVLLLRLAEPQRFEQVSVFLRKEPWA